MDDYTLYRSFTEITAAQELSEVLKQANVAHLLRQTDQHALTYLSNHSGDRYQILVKDGQKEKADEALLKSIAEINTANHPFQEMENAELREVLENKHEWNVIEVEVAKKILASRGEVIRDSEIKEWEEQKINDLKAQKSGHPLVYILAAIFILLGIFPADFLGKYQLPLPNVVVIIIGANYAFRKKKLPNEEKVFFYDPKTRAIGRLIFIFAFVSYAIKIWTTYRVN